MGRAYEHYIQVPLNENGLNVFNNSTRLEDTRTFVFTSDETDFLFKLFMKMNLEFGIFIEAYEEETLECRHFDRALELTKEFANEHANGKFSESVQRFKEALLLARKCQMPLIFDF